MCNVDETVTSGGFEVDTSEGITTMEHLIGERAHDNGWTVFVNVPNVKFRAIAECAKISGE